MAQILLDATRAAWGGGARPRPLAAVTHPYVEVHHDVYPATLPPDEHCRAIERQHRNQGWNGAYYNVGIDLDGRLWELRGIGWRSIGSHAARYDDGTPVDPRALTAVLFGNYEHSQVTSRQRAALDKLRNLMPDTRLRWHRMRAATACPGANAVPVLRDMNAYDPAQGDDMYADIDRAMLTEVHQALVELRYNALGRMGQKVHDLATPTLEANHYASQVIPTRISTLTSRVSDLRLIAETAATPEEVAGIVDAALAGIVDALEGLRVDGQPITREQVRRLLIELLEQAG